MGIIVPHLPGAHGQSVVSVLEKMAFRRDAVLIQAFDKAHGIGHAHAVVIHGMPAESRDSLFVHLILQGEKSFRLRRRILSQKGAEAVVPFGMGFF